MLVDISASLLEELAFMEQYAAAAYCLNNNDGQSNTAITCPVGNCPLVESAGATSLIEFQNIGLVDVTGFMAVDHTNQLIVISFRGSDSIGNWIGNFNIEVIPSTLCLGCLVHAGFYTSWALVRDSINQTLQTATANWPDYSIVSVGHSLGAAIATIGAGEFRAQGHQITLYTYGSPMVGNLLLANAITNQGSNFRVTRYDDAVPKLPGYPIGYAHISPEYWIDLPGHTYPSTQDVKVSSGALDLSGTEGTLGFSISDHLWPLLDRTINCYITLSSLQCVVRGDEQCGLLLDSPPRRLVPAAGEMGPSSSQAAASAAVFVHSKDHEYGLSFQPDDLTQLQLHDVFGAVTPPPRSANRLLRVLHARRVDGTLDLPFDAGIQAVLKRYPYAMDSALYWLRCNYAVDEDAAIMARIEAEGVGEEHTASELRQRAQDVGLYAPREKEGPTPYYGPQSGMYLAKLSDKEGDVFGRSEIDRIRAENIAKAEKEEQELQEQIDRITAEVTAKQADQQSQALAARPEQGVEAAQEIRPPNEFEKWILRSKNRAISKFTLDSPEVAEMTFAQRVLPSAVFVALFCAGCFLFAQYWVPPKRSERMFPDVSLSVATIGAIFALNLLAFACWGIPGMWPIMNRYFTSTPAYPRVLSMIGNTFSHQTAAHFLTNMLGLLIFGLSLHEDVGRGNFLAIYLSCGAVGSLASLTVFSLRRQLVTSSLGASGSMWGIMAAYCWIHANEKFSFIFMTEEQREKIKFSGWTVLSCLVVLEIVRFFLPIKTTDHASHLGGMLAGVIGAEMWKRNEGVVEGKQKRRLRWYEHLVELSSHDNSGECQCYLTSGPNPGYFQYYRFFDFRAVPSVDGDSFLAPPPVVTESDDQGDEPITNAYFNATVWNQNWSIESGALPESDSSYAQVNSPANVYITRNDSDPKQSTYLTLRTTRNSDFQSTAEIDCNQKNLMHSSIRARLRVIPNVAPGAVCGFFTFESNTEESDIEILTADPIDRLRYSNQPDYDPKTGDSVQGASTDYLMQDGRVWTSWLVYRLDWFPGVSQWWIDDDLVLNKTIHVPRKPSGMILNLWSDGGEWSGNMSVGDQVVVGVEWIEMVFNISGGVNGPGHRKSLMDGLWKRKSKSCEVGCWVDTPQSTVPGQPVVAFDNTQVDSAARTASLPLIYVVTLAMACAVV
ncbi:hypothetical protein DV736_g5596, partial [Chaetothyriales sp. CBS 134916]